MAAFSAPEATTQSAGRADILIVENVRSLRLADRYQQAVQNPSGAGIAPFAPMRILREDDLLGDRLTSCMRVEIEGRLFFVLTDGEGNLQGEGQVGFHTILRGAEILADTLRIVADRGVLLSPPGSAPPRTLPRGTQVARLFRHEGKTYIHELEGKGQYGWVAAGESAWEHAATLPAQSLPPVASLLPRVKTTLEEVNTVYGQLYGVLAAQTGTRERIPRWSAAATDSSIVCFLNDHSRMDATARSSHLLARRLEALVLGTSFRVTSAPGRVEIHP